MHMGMVVVDGRHVTCPISFGCWFIMNMIVTMPMTVMPEMSGVA